MEQAQTSKARTLWSTMPPSMMKVGEVSLLVLLRVEPDLERQGIGPGFGPLGKWAAAPADEWLSFVLYRL